MFRLSGAAVHFARSEIAARGDEMDFYVYLENVDAGSAFNVRFGVEVGGTRYPFALPGNVRGARQLVPAGGRVPASGELRVAASWAAWGVYGHEGGEGAPLRDRRFWRLRAVPRAVLSRWTLCKLMLAIRRRPSQELCASLLRRRPRPLGPNEGDEAFRHTRCS
jgi:hypothetical protein